MLSENASYIVGAIVAFLVQAILARLGIKIPLVQPPKPDPNAPPAPPAVPTPALPNLPLPLGGGILKAALEWLIHRKISGQALTPEERQYLALVRQHLPEESVEGKRGAP